MVVLDSSINLENYPEMAKKNSNHNSSRNRQLIREILTKNHLISFKPTKRPKSAKINIQQEIYTNNFFD